MIKTKATKFRRIFFLPVIFLLTSCLLIGCQSSSKEESKTDLENIFGLAEKDVGRILDWDFTKAETKPVSSPSLEGYVMEMNNIEFLDSTAVSVHLMFLEDSSGESHLTLLYAEYPSDAEMAPVSNALETLWGESRSTMYCSWADRIFWPEGLWAGSSAYNSVESLQHQDGDGKHLWGSLQTVADLLDGKTNPEKIYESWQEYSQIYAQSLKNGWDVVKKEPLVTAVLFENNSDFEKENVVIIDGFQKFMGNFI
ncbi:MAG: hypothetical protein KH828_10050 [Clostridiales bacterium]|nr:hypothetical protein [Clostridiales bacterium]